jgi:hypothetical protein
MTPTQTYSLPVLRFTSPKYDGALILPRKDLSEEHLNCPNTQSLHKLPMDQGSTPLDRTDRSNPMMATGNPCTLDDDDDDDDESIP